MGYKIEPLPLSSILSNDIKLPRFQRKSTWTEIQNFELAISVFQDYPIGVVILNNIASGDTLLLDGRQRRTALLGLVENPVIVYDWARKYLKFGKNEDALTISTNYWGKVSKYLENGTAAKKEKQDNKDELEDVNNYGDNDIVDIDIENSFDKNRQKEGLQVLLDLILMVHKKNSKGRSTWERVFDFNDYFPSLRYLKKKTGEFNPKELRKFLLDMDERISEQSFINYYYEQYDELDGTQKLSFETTVSNNWSYIEKSIQTLRKADKILDKARIGAIQLTNASLLDAQNIFSRINQGGTPLKPEELLSAKPYWNIPVTITNKGATKLIDEMYEALGVEREKEYVRWDIAATLISRIDKNHLIFSKPNQDANEELSLDRVSSGFKLLSSLFAGGMSAKSINDLESSKIDWDNDIEKLVSDLNEVCDCLLKSSFFQNLLSWKKPIIELLGKAIALEFICICYKNWLELGEPIHTANNSKLDKFKRDSVILFDRLVYEYEASMWSGSGDSKMARDIKDWGKRINCVTTKEWESYLGSAYSGVYKGKRIAFKVQRPLLYYFYCLKRMIPINDTDVSFEIDHIIPQEKFEGNSTVDQNLKDSIINLALIPKKSNCSKGKQYLNEISDSWLKKQIAAYSLIPENAFADYSDISRIDELRLFRSTLYNDAFVSDRNKLLANG